MQTNFTPAQLAEPAMASSEGIIRKCVHCGFCTATCPTYVLLGDENDSPRGRIYLMKEMLEKERAPTPEVVKHIDRCLSCLSCMSTCPSGVHYMHLVDHGRAYIEKHYRRPLPDRMVRALLAAMLPYPARFRWASRLGALAKPLGPILRRAGALKPLGAMLDLAPSRLPAQPAADRDVFPAEGPRRGRVALLQGCAQRVLDPGINAAATRLLNRMGLDVVFLRDEGCCGALVHHMGREEEADAFARHNIDVWTREIEARGLDAVVITTSGCGTTIKDYGFMLRKDEAYAEKAARISSLAKDVTEVVVRFGLPEAAIEPGLVAAYHAPCSMQHAQKIKAEPMRLLRAAGFTVKDVPEAHLCCGSAGTYNILQPDIARRLRDRKVENIARVSPDLVATGNIGCMTQIAGGTAIPILHTVELLDWATGGPVPAALQNSDLAERARPRTLEAAE